MLARLHSVTLEGIEGVICEVEVDVGLHQGPEQFMDVGPMDQGLHREEAGDVRGILPDVAQALQVAVVEGVVEGVFRVLGGCKIFGHGIIIKRFALGVPSYRTATGAARRILRAESGCECRSRPLPGSWPPGCRRGGR